MAAARIGGSGSLPGVDVFLQECAKDDVKKMWLGRGVSVEEICSCANTLYKRLTARWGERFGPDCLEVAEKLDGLAQVFQFHKESARAECLYKRALGICGYEPASDISDKKLGGNSLKVAISINNLAGLYMSQKKYKEAELLLEDALKIRENALGSDHPGVALSLCNLACLYDKQDRNAGAESLYKRALCIWEKASVDNNPDAAIGMNNLAELYVKLDEYDAATPLFIRALEIGKRTLGPNDPNVITISKHLEAAYHLKAQELSKAMGKLAVS